MCLLSKTFRSRGMAPEHRVVSGSLELHCLGGFQEEDQVSGSL